MSKNTTLSPDLRPVGRAAQSNTAGMFEAHERVFEDDGWAPDDETKPVRTEVSFEQPRKIITYNKSPDLPFDRSINPYRGCEHGCIYCFARPSHAFLGLSPGLDFETKLIARPDAPKCLRQELRAKNYRPDVMAIGTNTDPYQPIEKEHEIMRGCLQVLRDFRHPVAIVTKGTLIERDIDILADMAGDRLAGVGISVTTLDRDLARRMEPRVPAPKRRLQVIERLSAAGIPVKIMMSPIVPGLNDHEVEKVLKAGAEAGAGSASWIMLRLPREVSPLFREWLQQHYPDKMQKVMWKVREMHGGQDYRADWGKRMRGEGVYANLIQRRVDRAMKELGLLRAMPSLRRDLFSVPLQVGDQMTLQL